MIRPKILYFEKIAVYAALLEPKYHYNVSGKYN